MTSPNNNTMSVGNGMIANLKNYLASGEHSDLTLVCGSKEFRVHKPVLSASSSVFRRMLSGSFKEASQDTHTIELDHDDPEALEALIRYFYCFTYQDSPLKDSTDMKHAIKVYAIADKYAAQVLQKLATKKFEAAVASKLGADMTEENVNNLTEAIDLIGECTAPSDRTLWEIVLTLVKPNLSFLLAFAEFRSYLFENKELTLELLAMSAKAKTSIHSHATTDTEPPEDDQTAPFISVPRGQGRTLGGSSHGW